MSRAGGRPARLGAGSEDNEEHGKHAVGVPARAKIATGVGQKYQEHDGRVGRKCLQKKMIVFAFSTLQGRGQFR